MIQHWSGGEWEYSDDCGCERCEDFRKLPRVAPLEYSHCSRCKEPVDFVWDAEEKDWLSECCGAPAVPVDNHCDANYKPGHSSDFPF